MDETNRMTDPAFRKKDFARFTDTEQLFANQEDLFDFLALGHDTDNGGHPEQVVSGMDGYVQRAGLGVNPFPGDVGDVTFQLVHASGPLINTGYISRADVGEDLTGIYEITDGFGGDRLWCAYACVEKVGA